MDWGFFIGSEDYQNNDYKIHHQNEIMRDNPGDGYMPKSQARIEVEASNRMNLHLTRLAI